MSYRHPQRTPRLQAPLSKLDAEYGEALSAGRQGRSAEDFHGRRRERTFEAGGLKLITLHLISLQPSHGYDVIRAIADLVGGQYLPSPGTIYPTLSYLVDAGHATATSIEGGRKQYAITPLGQQALNEQSEALQNLLAKLSQGKARRQQQSPVPLARAIENFRVALHLKIKGPAGAPAHALTDAQVAAIATVLNRAALEIKKA